MSLNVFPAGQNPSPLFEIFFFNALYREPHRFSPKLLEGHTKGYRSFLAKSTEKTLLVLVLILVSDDESHLSRLNLIAHLSLRYSAV